MSAESLSKYVNANDGDTSFVSQCWDEADALVSGWVGDAEVPPAILDRATLEVGSELYHRRQAPNGVAQFATFDGSAIRVARDPMVGAYPILRPFVGGGFA